VASCLRKIRVRNFDHRSARRRHRSQSDQEFSKGGIDLVTSIDSNHPTSDLEKHRSSLIEEFTQRPPGSAKEVPHVLKN